jgi:hypothetical protein
MPIRSTQRAAIPIPVEAREEPFEAADEPVAPPVLPVLLPLVTGADVDVVVVAPPAATVVVVVGVVVVVVVGVAPLDEPASTSACAFSLETCTPTARQSPESQQLTAESVLLADCREGSFDCVHPAPFHASIRTWDAEDDVS